MNFQILFGVLFIASSTIVFACGLHVVNGDLRIKINRQLILICSALLIWSLGLAITATAANEDIAFIGHLLAPMGWGPMSGLLLHFTLLLTGRDLLLKKWWIYPVLYFPGLLMIYAFTILPALGLNTDSLMYTVYGWVPVVRNDGWDYFFFIYYLGYTVVNIMVLMHTRMKSRDRNVQAQVTVIASSYIIAYLFGTISDVVLEQWDIMIPQFASIFSLIPLGTIAYSIHKYRPLDQNNAIPGETILTDDDRDYIYTLMSFLFVVGGIINVLSLYLVNNQNNLPYNNSLSLFMVLIAVYIYIVNKLRIKNDFKDLLITIAYAIAIPHIVLRFVSYGSTTIWAFMLMIMVVCVLYNKKIMLISVIISSIMTQILVWAISPLVLVEVNAADHFVRLGFIAITAVLAFAVNGIYVARLKVNSVYNRKRKLMADISQELISADEQNMDEKIYNLLEQCGNFIGCERAYVCLFEKDYQTITYACEWVAEGQRPELWGLRKATSDIIPNLVKKFENQNSVKIADSLSPSGMDSEFAKLLAERGIRSLISVPIKENDRIFGVMGFNSSKPLREWEMYADNFFEIVIHLVTDVFTRIGKEKKIKFLAYHDPLTKLPNRDLFRSQLQQAIYLAQKTGKLMAVVFIDLDSFKSVNDTMGHNLGDELLEEVAQTISNSIRKHDLAARIGGDEFIVMINQLSSADEFIKIMDKLMEAIRRPYYLHGQEFFITGSAGVAFYPQDGEDVEQLIKNADTAMYKAKEMGKNQYVICSEEMKAQVVERIKLTNSLYRAMERKELMLYYQPQVSVKSSTIVGVEALLRWHLPDRGMISPAVFIPLAEQTGLINPIGEWVLETACRQCKMWQDQGVSALRIAVNVSVNQLHNPDFVRQVENVLRKTGLAPRYLELEITESAVSSNVDAVVSVLCRLKELGVSIAIDDFGTEYSSLSRLKVLPIDCIKMDMQLVQGIEENEKDQAIASIIISLAKNMNLKVIAEGVETEHQRNFLSQRMCDEIQGYYFYKPMPAEDINRILF